MNAKHCLFAALICALAMGESLGFAIAEWVDHGAAWHILAFLTLALANALFGWMFARRPLQWLP